MFMHLGSVIGDKTVLLLVWEREKRAKTELKKSGSKWKKEDVQMKVRCTFKIFKLFLLHYPVLFTRWHFS